MALRDLTVTSAQLTEAQIEELIAPYVRYHTGAGSIIFRPAAATLTNKQRMLAYLVALQGWPHLGEDQRLTTATPADLGKALNIDGGSLRPLLKQLKDAHLVTATGRAYSVANAAVDDLKTELQPGPAARGRALATKASKRRAASEPSRAVSTPAASRPAMPEDAARAGPKGKRRGGEGGVFRKWIQDGYFDKPRTFKEVLDRFHSQGRILKQTSLPGYLLEATRAEILTRAKRDVGGKRVYVYSAGPSSKGK